MLLLLLLGCTTIREAIRVWIRDPNAIPVAVERLMWMLLVMLLVMLHLVLLVLVLLVLMLLVLLVLVLLVLEAEGRAGRSGDVA